MNLKRLRTEYISGPTGIVLAAKTEERWKGHGRSAVIAKKFRRATDHFSFDLVHLIERFRVCRERGLRQSPSFLVEIFSGDVIFRDLVGVDFAFVGVAGIFDTFYDFGFK